MIRLKNFNGYKENKWIVDRFIQDFDIKEKTDKFLSLKQEDFASGLDICDLFKKGLCWSSSNEGADYWYMISCFFAYTLARYGNNFPFKIKEHAQKDFLYLARENTTYTSTLEARKRMAKAFYKHKEILNKYNLNIIKR